MKYAFQTHMSFINPAGKEMQVITKDDAPMAEAYDPTGAQEITHALNLVRFMEEHLPETYKNANGFYQSCLQAQNPPLVPRGETTSEQRTCAHCGQPVHADHMTTGTHGFIFCSTGHRLAYDRENDEETRR